MAEAEQWSFGFDSYDPQQEGRREALCTLGNGHFATRGAAPDTPADAIHYPGTYLAGGYNRLTSQIDGQAMENEDLVNLPNWLPLTFRIGESAWFRLDNVEILSFRQELELKSGLLRRDIRFRDGAGRTTRWSERRLVSMANPHLAALSVELTAIDWDGLLTVRSAIDVAIVNDNVRDFRGFANRHLETLELRQLGADTMLARVRTRQSHIQIVEAARARLYCGDAEIEAERRMQVEEGQIAQEVAHPLERGDTIVVEKIAAFYSSFDRAISEPGLEAERALAEVGRFNEVFAAHRLAWRHLWEECDIALEEHATPATDLKLRFSIFQILQTVSPHTADRDVGVPARGWHGEGYRGHIFWDELFVFPFLTLRLPMLTRALLLYRYRRLPEALRAARAAGHRGAMYPWQSGSDGREETPAAYFNPLSGRWIADFSFRQRHISAAVAYNVWQYYQATDDREFLYSYGSEMMLEIARFWASLATLNPAMDRFEIKGVMGPDEYHNGYPDADLAVSGGVNNNAYSNVLAAWVLSRALDVLQLMPPIQCRRLCERIALHPAEIDCWREIAGKLRVPLEPGGVISQFDGYARLAEFDWPAYQQKYGRIERLDFILEAENDTPNRYKLSKQADVLMLFYLFSADELGLIFEQLGYPFDTASIPRNIDYYLARTSHGSTLSRVAHSWVLARSDRRRSWELFQRALDSDIADIQGGTTREGIHIGAMGGVIDLVQRCYLGIEMRENVLHFDPALPRGLGRVKLRLRYRGHILDVDVDRNLLRVDSRPFTANPITIAYRGHFRDVAPGDSCEFRLLKPEDRDRNENRPTREAGQGSGRHEQREGSYLKRPGLRMNGQHES